MAIPKAKLMAALHAERRAAGLVRVYKCVWVSRKHEAKARKAFEGAIEVLESQGVSVQHKSKK